MIQNFWYRILVLFLTYYSSEAFGIVPPSTLFRPQHSTFLCMCICIDCARVTDCKAYHFVESKHEQPHMNVSPQFTPREGSPTIHVNIRTHRNQEEINRIWKEHEEETKKAEASAGNDRSIELRGETVYDMSPSTTVEYDVVQCADFIEDKGCWIRNMPEEIRKANPNFVPT